MVSPIKILLVEDNPGDVRLIREMLKEPGGSKHELIVAEWLSYAIEQVTQSPDIILLDLGLPDSQGIGTFAKLQDANHDIPIVVLTGLDDETLAIKAVRKGVQDYLVKGEINGRALWRVIRYAIERKLSSEILRESEEKYRLLLEQSGIGIGYYGLDGTVIFFNRQALQDLGGAQEDYVGKSILEVFGQAQADQWLCRFPTVIASPQPQEYQDYVALPSGGKWFLSNYARVLDGSGKVIGIQIVSKNITGRKLAENRQKLTIEILEILNSHSDQEQLIAAILHLISGFSGCEAIGIRLKEGDDFPYYQANGFIGGHVEAENRLCAIAEGGEITRDSKGNPILECMCGNIICGRFDPSKPFFTEGGSFWTNSTTDLLASTTEKDRQARTRNRCNAEGYESVAFIPLKSEHEIIGLLQLNDSHRNLFTKGLIEFYEGIGRSIGIVLERTRVECLLRESEQKYREVTESSMTGIVIVQDNRYVYINEKFADIHGYSVAEMMGRENRHFVHPDEVESARRGIERLITGELENSATIRRRLKKDGHTIWTEQVGSRIEYFGRPAVMGNIIDVTKRINAEHELMFLGEMLNIANDSVYIYDFGTRQFIYVNEATYKTRGYSKAELLGMTLVQLMTPENKQLTDKRRQDLLVTGVNVFETTHCHKDGSVMPLEIRSRLFERDGNKYVVAVARDITERKQAERELRLRANLLDSAMDSIIVEDLEGTFLYANEAAYKSRGYAKKEFLQMEARQLTAPQDREGFAGRRAKLKEMGSLSFEVAHIRKDGTLMPVDVHVKTVELEGEKVIFSIDRDITERRRGEEMLKDSELKYRRIVETAMEGITQTDKDGRITFVNGRIEAMLGYTAEEIIGQKLTKFIFEEDLAAYIEQRNELRKGIPRRFERRWKRKDDSEIWTSVSTNIIKDKAGQFAGTYALMTDITESRRAQKELAKSYHKMQKAVAGTIQAIALTAETRDPYTAGHQSRVAKLAVAIGEAMGFSKDKLGGLRAAGILHDIGKINVPSEILSKPGKLSGLEMSLIRTHSQSGAEILKTLELPWAICPAVRQHHERMDGSGYPSGLKGEAIVMEARIIAVADVVEAMASHRPYRPALGIDRALEEITKNKGKFYDPDVVDVCLKLFKEKGFAFEKQENDVEQSLVLQSA